jgi:hypothetical protein
MEDKLNKYYNFVSDDLVNDTKHWVRRYTDTIDHIGINFPWVGFDGGFYYSEEEIEEWLDRDWYCDSNLIDYLVNHYGLTKKESETVMNIYGIKLSTLLLSTYGR